MDMSGLVIAASGHSPTLPIQELTYIPGLTLTYDEFLAVIEGYQPALAGDHAHFSNLLDVYEGVPMNPAERAVLQSFFNGSQVLSRHVSLFGSDDPDRVTIRLKRKHLIRVQEKVFLIEFTHDFPESGCLPDN
jgi:hypothetical protein